MELAPLLSPSQKKKRETKKRKTKMELSRFFKTSGSRKRNNYYTALDI
jgi:hypothetical protein